MYEVFSENGAVTFTSRRPKKGGNFRRYKPKWGTYSKIRPSSSVRLRKIRKCKHDHLIRSVARSQGIEPHLLKALVQVESACYAKAVSPKGAKGLAQLIDDTAKRFGVTNSFEPKANLTGGAKYLRFLLKYYKGNRQKALAAYNAGEGAVDRYGGIPPYKETKNYVRTVEALYKKYKYSKQW